MKKLIVWLLLLGLLTACKKDDPVFDQAFADGIEAIAKGEYQTADAYLDTAQKIQPKNQAVKEYRQQLRQLTKADQQIQQGHLSAAQTTLDQLQKNGDLSRVLMERVNNLTQTVNDNQEIVAKFNDELAKVRSSLSADQLPEAEAQLQKIDQDDLAVPFLADEKEEYQRLTAQLQKKVLEQAVAEAKKEQQSSGAKESATSEKPIIPEELQDVWYEELANQPNGDYEKPAVKLTADTVYFYYNEREYQITQVDQRENEYILYWDMNIFAKRYGNQALGNNPLPFQVYLTPPEEGRIYSILKWGKDTFYSE